MISESQARSLIPRTWHAFFGRFGGLTEAQACAIEPVSQGTSLVLCAPTASGKTEALLGPLLDRLSALDKNKAGPRVLLICPTRALCNDMHRRIRRPVEQCRWVSDVKTGDSPTLSDTDRPQVVITTPESVDSLLSRQPRALLGVDALFLDELHLLDGDARGDHLRALIWRLKSIRQDLQILGASATAADAERLARNYAGKAAVTIRAGGGRDRQLDIKLREALTLEEAAQLIRTELNDERGTKLLVFANTRAEVEWLSAELSELRAFAHHGSLSKAQRLATEKGFLNAPSGVCVATMTLELGVDIGDVDRVVLLNPPTDVASFTQRIGRGNRRGLRVYATGIYSSPFDRLRFEHMIDCAQEGRLFPEAIAFRPTIIAQQAISLAFQNPKGWISAGVIQKRLPEGVRHRWTPADCRAILNKMKDEGYLHADSQGRFVPDEPARRDYEYGRMHAHISSTGEVEVVDEATGRKIGTARWSDEDYGRGQGGGEGLLLGGQHRKVTRVKDRQVFVEAGDRSEDASFMSRSGPRYSFGLARDLSAHLQIPGDILPFEPRGPKRWRVEHFCGTLGSRLLSAAMRERGFTLKKITPFFAECRLNSGKLPATLGPADRIEKDLNTWLRDGKGYRQLLNPLQAGPWQRFVPDDLLCRWVADCVDVEEFAHWLAGLTIEEVG